MRAAALRMHQHANSDAHSRSGYLPLNSLFGQLRQDMLQFIGEPAGTPKSSRL